MALEMMNCQHPNSFGAPPEAAPDSVNLRVWFRGHVSQFSVTTINCVATGKQRALLLCAKRREFRNPTAVLCELSVPSTGCVAICQPPLLTSQMFSMRGTIIAFKE